MGVHAPRAKEPKSQRASNPSSFATRCGSSLSRSTVLAGSGRNLLGIGRPLKILALLVHYDQLQCLLLDSCSVHLLPQFHIVITTLKSLESGTFQGRLIGFREVFAY